MIRISTKLVAVGGVGSVLVGCCWAYPRCAVGFCRSLRWRIVGVLVGVLVGIRRKCWWGCLWSFRWRIGMRVRGVVLITVQVGVMVFVGYCVSRRGRGWSVLDRPVVIVLLAQVYLPLLAVRSFRWYGLENNPPGSSTTLEPDAMGNHLARDKSSSYVSRFYSSVIN